MPDFDRFIISGVLDLEEFGFGLGSAKWYGRRWETNYSFSFRVWFRINFIRKKGHQTSVPLSTGIGTSSAQLIQPAEDRGQVGESKIIVVFYYSNRWNAQEKKKGVLEQWATMQLY